MITRTGIAGTLSGREGGGGRGKTNIFSGKRVTERMEEKKEKPW